MQKPTRVCKCVRAQSRARARSLHLLRHLGITHLLNATDDLLLPEPGAGFQCAPPHLARRTGAGPNLAHAQNRHAVALVQRLLATPCCRLSSDAGRPLGRRCKDCCPCACWHLCRVKVCRVTQCIGFQAYRVLW